MRWREHMSESEALLHDACGSDPEKVAGALAAASGRGVELAPGILARLEHALSEPDAWTGEGKPFVGFLLYLAAEFRLKEAHPLIARLLRLGEDRTHHMLSDISTESAPVILAETYGDDPEPILGLINDAAAGPFDRGAGLRALAILVHRGVYPRERLLDRMVRLGESLDETNEQDPLLGNQIVDVALRLHAVEIREFVLGLYERGVAEIMFIEPEYVDEHLRAGPALAEETRDLERRITSAWESVKSWAFFDQEDESSMNTSSEELDPGVISELAEDTFVDPEQRPYRAPPKIGRNDPCPCGSGKKYKKCCGK